MDCEYGGTTVQRLTGEPGGAKAQKRIVSMPFMVLGPGLAIVSGVR
jgi:hypothetical protein